jgi:hypothetical protein
VNERKERKTTNFYIEIESSNIIEGKEKRKTGKVKLK